MSDIVYQVTATVHNTTVTKIEIKIPDLLN